MRTVIESPWLKYNAKEDECVGGKRPRSSSLLEWEWVVCRSGLEKHGFYVGNERFKMVFSSEEVKGAVKSRWSPVTGAMEEAGEKIGLKVEDYVEHTEWQTKAGITQRRYIPWYNRGFVWWWVEIDA
jgi:hypothetical protein